MTTTLLIPIVLAAAVQITGVAGIANCDHAIGAAWHQWTPTGANCEGEFWPMVRDASQWQRLAGGTLQMPAGSRYIQGPNEPDLCPDQACMTPAEVVPLWAWLQATYSETHKLVAPVPSTNDPDWLRRFREEYYAQIGEYPHFDLLAAHVYIASGSGYGGPVWAKAQLRRYIAWADEWDVDGVAVTEWAAFVVNGDHETAIERADELRDWMRAQPEIKAAFWYSARDWPNVWPPGYSTALFTDQDELTPLGEWYNEENSNHNYRPNCVHSRGRFDRREVRECQM